MMSAKDFVQWCTRPPQAIVVVLMLVLLVGSASFFAGRLRHALKENAPPAATSVPHS